MLAWLNKKTDIIETLNSEYQIFEPAHAAYYSGKPGRPLKLLFQARNDFLSIWRRSDYLERVSELKILNRQLVIVNAPEAVRYVVAKRHENFERKTPQMRRALEFLLGDGLFISDKETWKQRRPLVADIVHKNRVPTFGRVMQQTVSELADHWQSLPEGTTVNVLYEMAGLTAQIISRSVFGGDLGKEGAQAVTEGFNSYQAMIDSINLGYFIGFDEGLPVLRTPSLRRSVKRIHSTIDTVIEKHLAGKGHGSAMVDLLIRRQQRNPELKLDIVALRNEAATIFMAGHETTAATLTWAWYLISRAPWVEKALHDEIEKVCGKAVPTIDDIPQLEWCRAVIEETLRLYPPVPLLARQATEADKIADVVVKPAALVVIVPWLLHRTESLFKHAHRFLPERFLGSERPKPYSYIPFSAGPRVCPGLQFGLTEAILCLAILAQRFRVGVASEQRVEPLCRLTLRPRGGLPAVLHRR